MASLRDIRRRIKSVKNTAQITKAMQMVAASKMKKAQALAIQGGPFAEQLARVLNSVASTGEELSHPFFKEVEDTKPCVVVISTDKGLCGGLNANLVRVGLGLSRDTSFVTIGRKGRQALSRSKRNLTADFELKDDAGLEQTRQISSFVMDKFTKGEITSVSVLYNRFVNTLVQEPTMEKLIPIGGVEEMLERISGKMEEGSQAKSVEVKEYKFEPSANELLAMILPRFVHFEIYHAFLNAKAAEHSARMVAMKNATDNAKNLVSDLTLEYNKARQAAITTELLEITTAQAAMD